MSADFSLGEWTVRPQRRIVESGDDSVHITPKSMAVLECLVAAAGIPVSRNELFDTVWPGGEVSDDTLTKCIVELRKAFGDTARDSRVIETIPKMGFRLIPAVELLADEPGITAAPTQWRKPGYVVAVLVVSLLLFFYSQTQDRADSGAVSTPPPEQSIAVLPFVNMSSDPEQEYFVDGLSEELLNLLAQVPGLKVVGRTSSFAFKNRNVDLREIGETLGVARVLEGSVRRSGGQIRITAQLINVEDGFHLWSDVYDRELTEIFAIQEEISTAIGDALQIQLNMPPPTRGLPTENMQAYALYLEGLGLRSRLNNPRALAALKKAIELDPDFAAAHYQLGRAYFDVPQPGMDREQRHALVQKHAGIAHSLQPENLQYKILWEIEEAINAEDYRVENYFDLLRQAYTADPGNNLMRQWHGFSLLALGYFERALYLAEQTIARDPLFSNAHMLRAFALRGLGRDKEAHQALLFSASQLNDPGDAMVYALWWKVGGDNTRADDYLGLLATMAGGDEARTRLFLDGLINPATRDMMLSYLPDEGKGLFLGLLQDDRFWPIWSDEATETVYLMHMLVPLRSPWYLNDVRFRAVVEQRGVGIPYWRNHPPPDFCDGEFESWICDLSKDGAD